MRSVALAVLIAMILPPSAAETLRELARPERGRSAQAETRKQETAATAESLRAWLYPKQRTFFARGGAKWRATRKTRRVGITTGGCRELLARGIEQLDFRATIVGNTLNEARERAWCNDTKTGLVDVLRQIAEPIKHRTLVEAFMLGGVVIEVRDGDSTIAFSNGSEIEFFAAEHVNAQRKKRGTQKHVVWIDEAQDFVELETFFDAVVIGMIQDFGGETWLTGTPGRDCAGMFYEVTKEESEGDEPMPGWEVTELSVADNPYFGHVVTETTEGPSTVFYVEDNLAGDLTLTVEERAAHRYGPYDTSADAESAAIRIRWEQTAGGVLKQKNWTGDEPDFKREWLGKWVKEDARYVYPIHGVPKHILLFAPQRLADNPFVGTHPRFAGHPRWYDHQAAVLDLPRPPRGQRPYTWMYALYADFGYHPDPFALGAWAFCYELPDVWEMFSWKQTRVHTDDQGQYLKLLWDAIPEVVSFVGDPAGKQDDFAVWQTRMNLPIEEANKRGKNTLEEFLADDIRRHRVHLRENSPLHTEMKYLVYLPTKPGKAREVHKHRKVNGVIHGDHCCDGSRYSYADLRHWLSKKREDKPPAASRAAYAQEEEREQRAIEDAETRRARELADGDELAREQYDGAGYSW